jgi:hypothetical protein
MRWEIDVSGDLTDLRMLQKAFCSEEFALAEENGKFVLRAKAFEDLNDADVVRARAAELVTSLSGASRALLGAQHSLEVGGVTFVRPDGTKNHFVVVGPAVIRFRGLPASIRITKPDGTIEEHHAADPVREWLDVALKDPVVSTALRLRDKSGLDWVQLYRLYEVIEDDTPKSEIVQNGWASKSEIDRFKHTANSPGALGDEARHGKERTQPPAHPLNLSEARSLIGRVLRQWISSKVAAGAP